MSWVRCSLPSFTSSDAKGQNTSRNNFTRSVGMNVSRVVPLKLLWSACKVFGPFYEAFYCAWQKLADIIDVEIPLA